MLGRPKPTHFVPHLDIAQYEFRTRDLEADGYMSRHDTEPSILDFPLPISSNETRSTKRAKLTEVAEESEATSIVTRVQAGIYDHVGEFMADVETASSSILAQSQVKEGLPNGTRQSLLSVEDRRLNARILAFKKLLNNLILREYLQRPSALHPNPREGKVAGDEPVANGTQHKISSRLNQDSSRGSRTVLTLYGNAPQPKQLFSSLQEPIRIHSENDQDGRNPSAQSPPILSASDPLKSCNIDVFASIREAGLPNGISTTQIVPVHSIDFAEEHKRMPTLGDLFAPPHSLPQLNPPKQSKHTATRSSSVNWFNPAEAATTPKNNRRDVYIYTTEPQSTGQWLNYSTVPSPSQPSSPEAKRKQRDRALSIGETKAALSQEAVAAHNQAKEDALFRNVYSTFAPSHDDAAAIVPECTKNRLWWKRTGENRFNSLLMSGLESEAMLDPELHVESDVITEGPDEDRIFQEAVESWVPETLPQELVYKERTETQRGSDEKDIDEVLREISELLETLHSYQRIRNLSLTSNARSTVGQNSQLTAMSGSPTSPSSSEFDVYNMLRSQLSLMISTLPPYAVAKLDGQQLENLSISTRILAEGEQYSGTMEEDEFTIKARQAALSSAAGTSARTQTPNMGHGSRSGNYQAHTSASAQYTQRGPYPTQASASRHSQPSNPYPPQQPYSARPTSSSSHYSGANTTQRYPSQRSNSATSPHPGYSQQHYAQSTPQPSQPSHYGQTGNRQYFQQSSTPNNHSYLQKYSTQQPPAPQVPMQAQPYQQRPSQPGYQQRAQDSIAYNASVAAVRSASPQKAQTYTPQQHRQSFSTPSQAPASSLPRQQYFQQTSQSTQYGSNLANSTAVNGSPVGASGFHTHMSAEQQAIMMDRQKAQLAQQNQANLSTSRQSSGTPQPAPNLQYTGQRNGIHIAQQNGTALAGGSGAP